MQTKGDSHYVATKHMACVIAPLMVMLARAIVRSCWEFWVCRHAHVRSYVFPAMDSDSE